MNEWADVTHGFTLELANIVAVWLEVLLYGVYSCLFFESLYIMILKKTTRTRSAKIFLGSTILMYLVATFHIALNLYRLLKGYVQLQKTMGPVAYFTDPFLWENIAHNVCLCIMTWLGDSLVIYRCFIIWNDSFLVVALPMILLVASIVINIITMYWFTHFDFISLPILLRLLNAIYPLAFAQNVLTTGLIVFRILHQYRASSASGVRNAGRLSLMTVGRIVVESAMLYTLQLLFLIILSALNHNGQWVIQSAVIPTIGIVFNLIAVRLHITTSRTLRAESFLASMPAWFAGQTTTQHPEPDTSSDAPDSEFTDMKLKRLNLSRPSPSAGCAERASVASS